MIEEILPGGVVVVESLIDVPEMLFPQEDAAVGSAVDTRRREFATVRWCARSALAGLGVARVAIVPGPGGAPGWPAGVAGSLTHCDGYRAAAVVRTEDAASLGIDGEPHERLPQGVLEQMAFGEERARLTQLQALRGEVFWERVLFSGKESVYKAWYPLTRRWLGFEDIELLLDPEGGFTARLLGGESAAAVGLGRLTGRWLVRDGLVLTTVVIPPSAPHDDGDSMAALGA